MIIPDLEKSDNPHHAIETQRIRRGKATRIRNQQIGLNIRDETGLLKECKKVREMGYTGKLCIHPSQLALVNGAFTPSAQEVARARRIVKVAETQGTGALVLDGKMVDTPAIKSAQRIVEAAERLDLH